MPYTSSGEVSFPALKGKQGGRTMYLILPSNQTLNNVIPPDMEPVVERSQRAFDPSHAKAIAKYIVSNPNEYVLGAMTYGCDQEGRWEPVEEGAPFGILYLPLNAKLRSVDGQHRRRGLKDAIDAAEWVAEDNSAVLIYVEPELDRRKQMFSDMNWTVRPVSKSVNVGFNSRDPFARAVNRLVSDHPLLKGRVETERGWISKGSPRLYTLGTVYDVLRRLQVGPEGRVSTKVTYDEDRIVADGNAFFSLLLRSRPEFKRALGDPEVIEEMRKTTLLLNGTTLKMLAGAINLAVSKRGQVIDELSSGMAELDFSPDAALWQKSGFVAPGMTTPMSRNQEVRAAAQAVVDRLAPQSQRTDAA
jgi:DGQHR domain-containing protein